MAGEYTGACHCGAIRWIYRTDIEPSQWVVRACQCSFCRAHAAQCTSDPAGTVEFSCDDAALLSHYCFALKSAEFLVCASCGVYVGAVLKSSDGNFATLNLRSMKTPVDGLRDAAPVSYESEEMVARIARRLSKWTPVVKAV